VPTLIEAGLVGADVDMWYGLFAPKATPGDIVDRLNKEVAEILNAPEAKTVFEAQGLVPTASTPSALEDIVVKDRTRWAEIVKSRGIQPE
jgi:tripartite-type tricarboxylate transporter receptor subunit TctC